MVFIHRKDEKMKKHSLILFLLIISVLTVIFTFSAYAEALDSGVCGETLTYLLDDTGTLTVSGIGNMYDYDSESSMNIIPSERCKTERSLKV